MDQRKSVDLEHSQISPGLWVHWVLASVMGFGIGAAVGNPVVNAIPSMMCTQSSLDSLADRLTNFPCLLPILVAALFGAIFGLAGGFMQWLVLRRQIVGIGRWILANTFGFAIATAVAMNPQFLGSIANPFLIGVLFGVTGGIIPWLVLRRQVARSGWWVPAHLLGSLVGGVMGIFALHITSAIGFYQLSWAISGAMFGAGFGAITGIALVSGLRDPITILP